MNTVGFMAALERDDVFVLVEIYDGKAPQLRISRDLERTMNHIRKLEGEPVNVFLVVGTPLAITQKDQSGARYVTDLQPDAASVAVRLDRSSVMQFDVYEGEAVRLIQEAYPKLEAGWLGAPEDEHPAQLQPVSFGQKAAEDGVASDDYPPYEDDDEPVAGD